MTSNFLLYQTPDGQTRLEVRLQNETVWLSLTDMSDLFQRDKSVISRHIRHIFAENRKYLVKGFTLNDEYLKRSGGNYFDELLARSRDIRFAAILMKTPAKQKHHHANYHQSKALPRIGQAAMGCPLRNP